MAYPNATQSMEPVVTGAKLSPPPPPPIASRRSVPPAPPRRAKRERAEQVNPEAETVATQLPVDLAILAKVPRLATYRRDRRGRRPAIFVGRPTDAVYMDALCDVMQGVVRVDEPAVVDDNDE